MQLRDNGCMKERSSKQLLFVESIIFLVPVSLLTGLYPNSTGILANAQIFRQTIPSQVSLPQAFRNMLPVLLTQTIILFQDTSLVYVISATDFFGAAAKVANRDGRLVEMYLFVAVIYFIMSFAASQYVKRLQTRLAVLR